MKIGVDVDGVLANIEKYQLEKGKQFFADKKVVDEFGYDIETIFGVSHDEATKFWTKYIVDYCLNEPAMDNSVSVINRLKSEGHEIHIITQRAHTLRNDLLGVVFRKMLNHFLKKNKYKIDSITYCTDLDGDKSKAKVCKDLGIDVMIEDSVTNCQAISEITNVICMNAKYNQNMTNSNDNITRVDNFEEVYEVISKMNIVNQTENKYEPFTVDKYKTSYGIVRVIGTPIFQTLLKPTILNKQYIPEEGAILLCGNHLHVWDQFPVICATKRTTHWMSKKEYFDSQLGPFFKKTGAICVDREGDTYKAINITENYLNIGSAIGLFPEGTRNGLKRNNIEYLYSFVDDKISKEDFLILQEKQKPLLSRVELLTKMYTSGQISKEQFSIAVFDIEQFLNECVNNSIISEDEYNDSLLLPFKKGAVNMARSTGAKIVPFGVTGDYKIGNDNLIIDFGEPFNVNNEMDLDEANSILRGKILNLVQSNLKK